MQRNALVAIVSPAFKENRSQTLEKMSSSRGENRTRNPRNQRTRNTPETAGLNDRRDAKDTWAPRAAFTIAWDVMMTGMNFIKMFKEIRSLEDDV